MLLYMKYTSKQIVGAVATGIGAFGGFPTSPQFAKLAENEMFRWAMVFILVWQGGGNHDPKLSALVTAALYAFSKAILPEVETIKILE